MHLDERVVRYTGGLRDRAGSEAMLRHRILEYYAEHPGLGVWATIERATGECIGIHNLNHLHGEPDIQVGYMLYPEYWGRGYATEMCVGLLRYGFATLGLPQIVAITDPEHHASQHVLRKAGLRATRRTIAGPSGVRTGPRGVVRARRGALARRTRRARRPRKRPVSDSRGRRFTGAPEAGRPREHRLTGRAATSMLLACSSCGESAE